MINNANFVPENITRKPVDIKYIVTEKEMPAALDTYKSACQRFLHP